MEEVAESNGNVAVVEPVKKRPTAQRVTPTTVATGGVQIVLPERMTVAAAIKALQRRLEEDEEVVGVMESFDCHPFEGLIAMMDAMREIYGWATPAPTPGFFGPTPPTRLSVEIAPGVFREAFWGAFTLEGVEGQFQTKYNFQPLQFVLAGKVKRKYSDQVADLTALMREKLATASIFKGQAIVLPLSANGNMTIDAPPKFMGVMDEPMLIFSDEVRRQVQANIFTPIERTVECRLANIPMKRGVLLEGPYGTGKTLTAYATAAKAVKHGWTFVYIEKAAHLTAALEFAKGYQPAVIFAEDLDSAVGEDRDDAVNDILNTIDGIGSKGTEIMVVLTTNHVEVINPAMLRPGRLDAIISVQPPDGPAVERLLRHYGNGLLADKPLPMARQALAGKIPAVIREALERAKLYAIAKTREGEPLVVTDADVADAALAMGDQVRLLNREKPTPAPTVEELLVGKVWERVEPALREMNGTLSDVWEKLND